MWLLIGQLTYVIPSVILYVLIIFTVVLQWNSFKSSFFQLYIFDFAMNTFTLLNTFYVLRFANYTCQTCFLAPVFQNLDEYINSSFMYAVQYHMAYIQYLSIFIASLNRLTVIQNFSYFEPLWKNYSYIAMIVIVILPAPNTVWMMTYGAWWVYEETGNRYMLHSPILQSSISLVLLPFMVVSIVVSLCLNLTSLILVRRVSQQRRKLVETHFLKLIVITCAVQLVGTVLTILLSLAPRPSLFFTFVLYSVPFVSDCLTLCHPWLLLSLSKPIRDSLLRVLRPTPSSSSILVLEARAEVRRLDLNPQDYSTTMATIFTFLISLSYAIPSIVLYLLTICVIYGNRKTFDSSFFKMYAYDCLMNLITYFKTFSTMRLPSVTCYDCVFAPMYKSLNDYLPMSFIFSTGYHFAYVQYATTTLISLNRLTVLLNFNLFEPIWCRFAWLMMVGVVLFPFLNTRVALNYTAGFVYVNSTDSFALSSKMPVWEIYGYLIPFMIVTILISLVSNVASLIFVKNAKLVNANRAESNFIVITSITCTIQLIGTFLSVGMLTLQSSPIYTVLSFFQLYVSDALTLVQPWLLVFFSHGIRRQLKKMLCLQSRTPASSTLFKSRSMTL